MAVFTPPAALVLQAQSDGTRNASGSVRTVRYSGFGKIVEDGSGYRFIDKSTGASSALPAYGDTLAGFPTDLYIAETRDDSTDDLWCTLTLTLQKTVNNVIFTRPDVIIEADGGEGTAPTVAHPRYKATIIANQAAWNAWDKAVDDAARATAYAALPSLLQECADLVTAGFANYSLASPVVRRTTRSTGSPGTLNGAFIRQSPPAFSGMATQWLRLPDRCVMQGANNTWEIIETWRGAAEWPTAIYP